MKLFYLFITLLITSISFSQTKLSGKVTDGKDIPIPGANVYVEGTYDGATTNEKGEFTFTTIAKGNQVLVISFLSYETISFPIVVEEYKSKSFKLKESVNTLDAVVINAGTFEAGDKAKVTVFKTTRYCNHSGFKRRYCCGFANLTRKTKPLAKADDCSFVVANPTKRKRM